MSLYLLLLVMMKDLKFEWKDLKLRRLEEGGIWMLRHSISLVMYEYKKKVKNAFYVTINVMKSIICSIKLQMIICLIF